MRGWADRFAQRLARDNPPLEYANLAVRGRRLAEVRDEQLDTALAMRPDLVGFCAGMNDVTAPDSDFPTALDIMEELYAKLRAPAARCVHRGRVGGEATGTTAGRSLTAPAQPRTRAITSAKSSRAGSSTVT